MLKKKIFKTGSTKPAEDSLSEFDDNQLHKVDGRGTIRSVSRCLLTLTISVILLMVLCSCRHSLPESATPRYVITSPEVGEIVYLLQGIKNVAGVTNHVNFPPAYQDLPQVGGFGNVSIEGIIKLNPTLVITSGLEQEQLAAEINKLGIETLIVYPQSLNDMLDSIVLIAEKMGIEERGITVRDSLESEFGNIHQLSDNPLVYVEIYGNPIMSVSKSSFIGELVLRAGGINIFDSLPREYSRIRQEDVIKANPEVIILTYPGVGVEDIRNRKGWQNIDACLNGRIYTVNDINPDIILRAGPRSLEGVRRLQELFRQGN